MKKHNFNDTIWFGFATSTMLLITSTVGIIQQTVPIPNFLFYKTAFLVLAGIFFVGGIISCIKEFKNYYKK